MDSRSTYLPTKKSWRKIARFSARTNVDLKDLLQARTYFIQLIDCEEHDRYPPEAQTEFSEALVNIDNRLIYEFNQRIV